ncbi:MAG: D-alanine--D-alanine ligase [Acidobacteriota bacterium]|nr:D-alanine--D-alanine ligase [Acidobacteriota bacterium]
MKTTIGVIFGGRSGEHEISIRSANTVIEQIDKEKYRVIPIAITGDGNWLNPPESLELLSEAARQQFPPENDIFPDGSVGMLGDTRYKGLASIGNSDEVNRFTAMDVIFPVLHGTFGEDGTIQGIFEMADIPYVGCGVLSSACGMDKVVMKTLFKEAGLPICKHVWFLRSEWERGNDAVIRQVESKIGYPCFIKPANLGSSVGVSRAVDAETLKKSIDHAAEFDRKIIVEEALQAREIECAVIGNDEPQASQPGEYLIRDKNKAFLDYTEKYAGTGNNEFVVPAPVSQELSNKIKDLAIRAFKAVDGSGLGRIDFFLRNDTGTLLVSEINTMPGLTDASGFPKMWAGSGMDLPQVLDLLVKLAFERHNDIARNKTTLGE